MINHRQLTFVRLSVNGADCLQPAPSVTLVLRLSGPLPSLAASISQAIDTAQHCLFPIHTSIVRFAFTYPLLPPLAPHILGPSWSPKGPSACFPSHFPHCSPYHDFQVKDRPTNQSPFRRPSDIDSSCEARAKHHGAYSLQAALPAAI